MVEAIRIAREISHAAPLVDLIAAAELASGPSIRDDDTDELVASIASRVSAFHHPVGTCRMGPEPDGGAVVDARGQVHGVDRLHVVDASIMPTIPSAPTRLATITMAERLISAINAYLSQCRPT
jgi:choline dehydrogenase